MGERQLCKHLRECSIAEVRPAETKRECLDTLGKEDIGWLGKEDIGWLSEILVTVSHKWEELGIALALPTHELENCRRIDNKISLSLVLSCWLSRDIKTSPVATLNNLRKALSSAVVAAARVAQHLEDRAREAREIINTASTMETDNVNSLLTISYQSPYLWKKDDQPLANIVALILVFMMTY